MSDQREKQKIRQVIADWMTSTAAGDIDHVLTLMAKDVVFLRPGQPPMKGRPAYAKQARAMGKVQVKGKVKVKEIHLAGKQAVCWLYISVTVTPGPDGAPLRREGNVLSVYRKERNGQWVLFRDANLM